MQKKKEKKIIPTAMYRTHSFATLKLSYIMKLDTQTKKSRKKCDHIRNIFSLRNTVSFHK